MQSSWSETAKLIKPIGFFGFSFFFNALVPVASWDLEVPTDVVDVNCQNLPIIGYTRSCVYRNEILKSMLTCSTYPVSPQLPRGFRPTFLDALSLLS